MIYIGPFLRCFSHAVEVSKKVYGCPEVTCELHKRQVPKSNKYCPVHGLALQENSIGVEYENSVSDFAKVLLPRVDDFILLTYVYREEGMYVEDIEQTLLGANKIILDRSNTIDIDDDFILFQKDINFEAEKAKFQEFYKNEIATLAKAYDKIEIDWGIIRETEY